MADLRAAAQAVLDRWDSPQWEWAKQGPTADLMAELRAALAQAEPVEAVACSNTFGCRCPKHFAAQQAEPVQAVATFDEVWAAIDWDKWRLQPIRELVRMIHSKTSPAAPVQQAEPVQPIDEALGGR